MQNLHHEILYAHRCSEDEHIFRRPLLRNAKKYKHGERLRVNIHVLFYGDSLRTVALTERQNEAWYSKRSQAYIQISTESFLFYKAFTYGDGAKY
jgi:hypothetical protein